MSPSHSDHRGRGTLGTVLLAGACTAGAAAYTVIVGPSMLPPGEVHTTTAAALDAGPVAEEPEVTEESTAPVGLLQIHVSDRDRAWVQTLSCAGNAEEDPKACAALAEVAAEFNSDPVVTSEDFRASDADPRPAADPGVDPGVEHLFTEVGEGTVCTDRVYGPQEATIVGTWEGLEVETNLSRKGSCEEARWQRLRAVTDQIS